MSTGTTIGQYRILEPLGEGGMGVVYRARNLSSGRAVALKTVPISAPRWLDNIRREIDALTRVQHPGVVRIVEHGVHHGLPWYAMDLLEGESLRNFIQRIWSPYRRPYMSPVGPTDAVSLTEGVVIGSTAADLPANPLSVREPYPGGTKPVAAGELRKVLRVVRRLCATLAFLHGEGIVNCDLKPENILLVDGLPIIIDFGLTAYYPGGSRREALEGPPSRSGTHWYMSPEQIRGEFVDARSDLYSVGCILYELLASQPPFLGGPRETREQHLSCPPPPPSEKVSGLSPELESLTLKLLEKDVGRRFGYADEIASALGELTDENERWDAPPPRPYLYRSRLVGRGELLETLQALRGRAADGSGALVLMAGESGVGKTRLAMELTRAAPILRMQTVTSEAPSFSAEGTGAVVGSPLHFARPLLRAIADRCQEGGLEVSERLLGERRALLAQYEPLVAQVPSGGAATSPPPVPADVARKRLFQYLSETLRSFSLEAPVLWILDDIGWADELSLSFLRSLPAEFLESTPVLILATYRSEEASDLVSAIARMSHVKRIELSRLDVPAVSSMVSDMLAMNDPSAGLVEFIAHHAEGNPFFVAEYLRTAVAQRVIYRDQRRSWQLLQPDRAATPRYESLTLPGSLREHIGQRLHRLSPAAQHTAMAVATIGREAEIDTLREVASLSEEVAVGAVDELLRRQVLEQPKSGRVRFAHDKLREVAYGQAAPQSLMELHAKAAVALESRLAGRPDANRFWATLGHHFSAARRREPAARYLKLAADHARSAHANDEAVSLYRAAVKQVDELVLSLSTDAAEWHRTAVEIHESLADVCGLTGQNAEARAGYEECLARSPESPPAVRARWLRKIGKMWEASHEHDQALRFYGTARALLGPDPTSALRDERDEWFQVRLNEMWVHYWLNRVPEMDAIVTKLAPLVDGLASPSQRVTFFRSQFLLDLRRRRFVVTEDTLELTRATLASCDVDEAVAERPMAQFHYGFALLWSGRMQDAERELKQAAELARRAGDTALRVRCVSYLALAARMQGRPDETRELTDHIDATASAYGMLEYVGAVRANRAWLALKHGDLEGCRACAREALEIWQNRIFPFHWTALVPLLEAALARGDLEEAASCAGGLIAPSQQALPSDIVEALARAGEHWRARDVVNTRVALEEALSRLADAGYR